MKNIGNSPVSTPAPNPLTNSQFKDKDGPKSKDLSTPVLGKLFCDKLAITVKTGGATEDTKIKETLKEMLNEGYGRPAYRPQYSFSAILFPSEDISDSPLLVQCEPRIAGIRPLRIEFNPKPELMGQIHALLNMLKPYAEIVAAANVTRVDSTVDVHNVHIDQLLFHVPKFRRTSAYYRGGRTETYYIGTRLSPKLFCFYDKVAEVKRRNKGKIVKATPPNHDVTRIEARILHGLPMAKLSSLTNPFSQLFLTYSNHRPGEWQSELFMRAARADGLQEAILLLPKQLRTKVKKTLQPAKFWLPEEIWECWPSVVGTLLNPPPTSF
jgi:hypothetical protein